MQKIAVGLIVLLVVAFAAAMVLWFGMDAQMGVGVGAGLFAGLGLTLLGGRSLSRALNNGSKSAVMTHLFGGFVLRLALLVVGFFAFAFSGLGNPVGFAVAFLAGAMIALFRQVMVYGGAQLAPAR
jgi:hypothetical protein